MAILNRDAATTLVAPDISTIASWAASASNLFGAVVNGSFVIFGAEAANFLSKPFSVFRPVPTAVPPCARG